MKKQIITLTVAALTLSSCGIYTQYKPATEVPDNLYGEEVAVADTVDNIGNLSWQEIFTDPRLQELIEQGLRNNTDLQSAQWRVKEAEAAMLSAKLAYLPSFALSPQGTASSFDKGKAVQTYTLPVAASWEIDIFGRIRNAKRQAKALLANEAAVSQMEATYYTICTSVLDLKEQINQVENSLSLLLAESPHAIERTGTWDSSYMMKEHFPVGIPVQMLANRPDVRSAERALEAAFYATNQARSAFYPSIVLSGSAGWTNSAGSMIVNPGKFIATAVASLTQPLFNKGANIAQLKIAKAQQEEAKLSFQQALLNAGSEVNEALVKYQTARDKSVYYDKQINSLNKALESTSLLMQHGNTTYLEVLTAQQTLLNAELTQVANRFTEMQGVINLYQALGGGRD